MSLRPFTAVTGRALPLLIANVDTDVIIRVERMTSLDPAVLAPWAFEALRYRSDGSEDEEFVLNDPAFRAAPILLGGENFGCGSSREPAVWAIMGLGIRCIVAPSFGDIFRSNCVTNGLLPVTLDQRSLDELARSSGSHESVTVDLPAQRVGVAGRSWPFDIGALQKAMLVDGLDEMDLALRLAERTAAWERQDRRDRPWAWPALAGIVLAKGRLDGIYER